MKLIDSRSLAIWLLASIVFIPITNAFSQTINTRIGEIPPEMGVPTDTSFTTTLPRKVLAPCIC